MLKIKTCFILAQVVLNYVVVLLLFNNNFYSPKVK